MLYHSSFAPGKEARGKKLLVETKHHTHLNYLLSYFHVRQFYQVYFFAPKSNSQQQASSSSCHRNLYPSFVCGWKCCTIAIAIRPIMSCQKMQSQIWETINFCPCFHNGESKVRVTQILPIDWW